MKDKAVSSGANSIKVSPSDFLQVKSTEIIIGQSFNYLKKPLPILATERAQEFGYFLHGVMVLFFLEQPRQVLCLDTFTRIVAEGIKHGVVRARI